MAGTVTVALKLPNGLHLDLPGRPRVTLKGYAVPVGQPPAMLTTGGFAMTQNVDEEFFEAWITAHADSDLVRKRLIFAHSKVADAKAEAASLASERSGLEPIDPENPGKGIEKVGVGG